MLVPTKKLGDPFTRKDLLPVGDERDATGASINGLHKVNHYMVAAECPSATAGGADHMNAFYQTRGRFVLGTVCDGSCGIDVMVQMLGLPETPDVRKKVSAKPSTPS